MSLEHAASGALVWVRGRDSDGGHRNSRVTMCLPSPGWNELLIASFSHRSIAVKDGILLATGLHVHRNSAHSAGVGAIFDRWAGWHLL